MNNARMKTSLFADDEIPILLSPKLKWLALHGLDTHYDIELEDGGESPETGEELRPWICWLVIPGDELNVLEPYGAGYTEYEAILNYCEKTGTHHYSLSDSPSDKPKVCTTARNPQT